MAVGLQGTSGPSHISPAVVSLKSDVHFPLLASVGPVTKGPVKGSGFFYVSKTVFGPRSSPNVSTKNNFGTLRDEEECYDMELGLWEHEIDMVKKYVKASTRPKIEDYSAWLENMRKFYDSLTKVNENDAKVKSETDEMTRFMKLGSKF
ncbi:hypothetical protein HanPSC8_Chr06g0255531 [Helianthus annuus]|nr:hypothetical protein HanPSC8_Chr06g0255531 [Helianthus annuus]